MKHVLVLGGGMQARTAVYDLVKVQSNRRITLLDTNQENLNWFENRFGEGVIDLVLSDAGKLKPNKAPLADADIILNLLPKSLEITAFNLALQSGCDYVSTNYGHVLRLQHQQAKQKGCLVLPEMGLDPGIDLILCAQLLKGLNKVTRLDSYGTGVPTPEFRNNPLDYKITWTFAGVLDAYQRPGVLIRNGKVVQVPAHEQFQTGAHDVDVSKLGTMEAYVNGDTQGLLELAGLLGKVEHAGRYSLRYPGHREFWSKMSWLGLLNDVPRVDLAGLSPREFLRRVLEPKLALKDDEKDAVYLRVVVEGNANGQVLRRIAEVYTERDLDTGFTAMSRSVGCAAAIAVEMVLEGHITGKGVLSPLKDVPCEEFLRRLESRGIRYAQSEDIA